MASNRACDNIHTFVSENVTFLDNCFDNSFLLQNSLLALKKLVADEENETQSFHSNCSRSKEISSIINLRSCRPKSNRQLQTKTYIRSNCIKFWGLPEEIVSQYETKGITEMFDWQVECLGNSKVLVDYGNLVFSAPTSAGKTLVAEILTIKTVLERQKKVIIILPFVSVVREKMLYLQDILSTSGIRVEGFMGSYAPPGGFQAVHIAICTMEKANSLVNRLMDEGNISDLGAIIVDEMHLLGDPNRGYILELLLTKIKYVSTMKQILIQIVAMSATFPNLKVISKWLDAELFITEFRPIPLDEYCLVGKNIYNKEGECVTVIKNCIDLITENEALLQICLDTMKDGCSILIFCTTKNWCESLAQLVASSFYKLGCTENEFGTILHNELKAEKILEVLEQLKNCPVGLDEVLKKTISFGVAYHHAGLTYDERDIVEGAFRSGAIRVLIATSTLSSGVNLPARKVIIRSPVFQKQAINILTYKQMVGRAGRMGKDKKGESILICSENEKKIGFDLMKGILDPIQSCIDGDDKYMRAILEVIASQVATTKTELILYEKCTLYSYEKECSNSLVDDALSQLKTLELIRIQNDDVEERCVATPLGKACLSSSMAPNDGISLFCELQKARQCLVLETDLHLIYLVTPYSVSNQWGDIDWLHLLNLWESLTNAMKRVGHLVGIQESFIIRCVRSTTASRQMQNKVLVHKRFYTALALQDLINEVPLSTVATKFKCPRGFLQSLQQSAATFAGMVTAFCRQLGWKNLELLMSQFQDRLHFGIHSDLLDLMKLSSLNGLRARSLFNAGYETISAIASADVYSIENALYIAIPFQSEKERQEGDVDDTKKRNKMKNIWITGCCGMTVKQAAENLIIEARKYLEKEIGVAEIKWVYTFDNKPAETDIKDKDVNCNGDYNNIHKNNSEIKCQKMCKDSIDIKMKEITESSSQNSYAAVNILESHNTNKMKETHSIVHSANNNEHNEEKVLTDVDIHIDSDELPSKNNTIILSNNRDNTVYRETLWNSIEFTEPHTQKHCKKENVVTIISQNKYIEHNRISDEHVDNMSISNDSASHLRKESNNSSLFEESLPLDLIPSKLFDEIIKNSTPNDSVTEICKKDTFTTKDNGNIITTFSLANAFKESFENIEDNENIKLFYDEVSKSEDSLFQDNTFESEITEILPENSENLSKIKNIPLLKYIDEELKVKKHKTNNTNDISTSLPMNLHEYTPSFRFSVHNKEIKCIILDGNSDLQSLSFLKEYQMASVFLITEETSVLPQKLIGYNCVKKKEISQVKQLKTIDMLNNGFIGLALYFGQDYCIFCDMRLTNRKRSVLSTELMNWIEDQNVTLKLHSVKYNYVKFKKCLGINLPSDCIDTSLCEWLIDSDEKEISLSYLIEKYCDVNLRKVCKENKSTLSNFQSMLAACIQSWAIWNVTEKQMDYLRDQYEDIEKVIGVEIEIAKILGQCEYHGLNLDKNLSSQMLMDVKSCQNILQSKAQRFCGHKLNFNSSREVAKVLGLYNGRKVSTKKSVLNTHNTPIANVIVNWRKLNAILTKTLYPLTAKANSCNQNNRINPSYTMHTCTGRISMHEPNLQSVPRTFSIPSSYLSEDHDTNSTDVIEFNCRNIFKASPGHVLVSADYCQIEMRILTHYCQDEILTTIMKSDVDVFTSIAASWGCVSEDEVNDDLRQRAKQLCYGIIYGMGSRTLGMQLDVSEMEAAVFMDTFRKTYPAIKVYTQTVIEQCKRMGYVETLVKRRRYLSDINSKVYSRRCAAERQAVNTTIQGSAADIVKTAMCAISKKVEKNPLCKAQLILQMHDELIYEVPETCRAIFVDILKETMENTITLNVPLPVKVKIGYSWGSMESC